jgi:hypothetical protein
VLRPGSATPAGPEPHTSYRHPRIPHPQPRRPA